MARKPVSHAKAPYDATQGSGAIIPRLLVVITCIAAIGAMIYRGRGLEMSGAARPLVTAAPDSAGGGSSGAGSQPAASPQASPEVPAALTISAATPDQPALPPRVGIVSGHWGNDTGAECPDGLREVDVNLEIATHLVQILLSLGYEVDLLEEFDGRLHGYYADVLVSIHADSCEAFPDADPPMSGFKVASVEVSSVPEAETRLVTCLARHYAARTGMYYHASTVTVDMTRYHTFYEIDARTPAAIIETGFMAADRHILTGQPDLVAQAISEGIVCFLTAEETP